MTPYPPDVACHIREEIGARLDAGRLPAQGPVRMFSWRDTTNSPCDACDRPIETAGVQYEFDGVGLRRVIFHLPCAGLWEAERRRRGGSA